VINAVRKFITEYNTEIDEIIMQGAGERQAVMYQRFFQSAGKYFPGWHYDGKHSLVRDVPRQPAKKVREQGVAEGVNDYLWHGSKTEHDILYPQQANDTGGKEESNKNAVYATPSAKTAIAMGLTTPGSDTGMFPNDPQMVLFSGNIRKGQMVYLHKVPKDLFIKHNSREWYSKPGVEAVKPIEVKTIPVDQWLHLIRQATPQDLELRKKYMKKQGVAEGKLVESAVFLNPNTVVVGQAHGQPLELSPDTLKKIQAIAAKHGAYYEGNGTDRSYTKGQIDRYVGSWDDEVAKTASPNDPKWLYVLFANVDANNRVQRVGVDPKDTIFNRLLATAKDNSFQGIGYTPQALQKFLQMASEGQYDFVKMSQQPATQENLTRFLKAGEVLMWPSNWEQYPNKAGKIAKAATVDVRDQYLATRKAGVYVTGSGHLKAVQNITGKQGVAEGLEFFSMPLRMSEYRGKTHPATNEPYDAKFKFSGDLKDRVHSLLDAGTKPTLLQVNPRHLLATQDWLSTQGGGKPAFATMKQHPVVLQKNNKLYILDGHHRSADAHKSGTPIQVYLFKDEL
jgi:hypothetical protein